MNEQKLKEIFNQLEFDRDEESAKVYGITEVGGEMLVNLITQNKDIYSAIDEVIFDLQEEISGLDYVNFITWGWAAPLNENGGIDGPPSGHKDRRRVRLIVSVNTKEKEVASTLQFQDDKENLMYDFGAATGSLADAISGILR